MTFAAMAETLHEEHPPRLIPILSRRSSERLWGCREEPAPVGEGPTHREGEWDLARPVRSRRRLHALFEIRVQRDNVIGFRISIRGEGHRRVKRMTPCNAETQRTVKVGEIVAADTIFFVGRDIGAVDGPDRGLHA